MVKTHNSVAGALMEYEAAWHRAWCDAVKRSRVGANAPVLARHPTTGRLCVNLDPATWQLVREAQCMERMGLEVPPAAAELCERAAGMRHIQAALLHALRRYVAATTGTGVGPGAEWCACVVTLTFARCTLPATSFAGTSSCKRRCMNACARHWSRC